MADFIVEKKNFDMQKLNEELSEFSKLHGIDNSDLGNLQLVIEEYLTNILFPYFENAVEISVSKNDNDIVLVFSYKGIDYTNKITDNSLLSFKILDNKTKEMQSTTKDGITSVKFII